MGLFYTNKQNMKNNCLIAVCWWVICGMLQPALAQNLVPNPSFEDHNGIPDNYAQFYYVNTWFGPYEEWYSPEWDNARPTYFCYDDGTNELPPLFQYVGVGARPHTGRAFAGMYLYSASYLCREYITVPLSEPLEVGTEYDISFWLLNDSINYDVFPYNVGNRYLGLGINSIGAYFSVEQPTYPNPNTIIDVEPQAEIAEITYQQEWTQYRFSFVATEAYRFLTIGNFRSDEETLHHNFSPPADSAFVSNWAYYYIDDVMLCPTLRANPDTTVCVGSSVDLSAKGCGNFRWHVMGQEDSILSYTSALYIQANSTKQYIVSDSLHTDTVTVVVEFPPSIALGKDSTICLGDSLLLLPQSQHISHYLWNNGSTDSTLLVSEAATYVLSGSNACGVAVDTINIQMPAPLPVHFLGMDTVLCSDTAPFLLAANTNNTFYWQDGSTASPYAVAEAGSYALTLYNVCESQTDSIHIEYQACGKDCELVLPTAFSPNEDGNNDLFSAYTRCPLQQFSLQIYNRYGEQVFSTHDTNFVWDGKRHGIACEIGSYAWQLSYTDWSPAAVPYQQKGWLVLIR